MEINAKIIKVNIDSYINGNLTIKELSDWARIELYKMLDGEVIKLNKISLYCFITFLADMEEDDFDVEQTIKQISCVLMGKEDISYLFQMKIPEKYVNKDAESVKDFLLEYSNISALQREKIEEIERFCSNHNKRESLTDLLRIYISDLLIGSFTFYSEDSEMNFDLKRTIFMSLYESNAAKNQIISQIIRHIDCYLGINHFSVSVVYQKGIPSVSLLI